MISASLIPVPTPAALGGDKPVSISDLLSGLKPGQVVTAKVIALLGQSMARLEIDGLKLDVRSQAPLDMGAQLKLTVEPQGNTTRLVLAEQTAPQGQGGAQAAQPAQTEAGRQPVTVLSGRAAAAQTAAPEGGARTAASPANAQAAASQQNTQPQANAQDAAQAVRQATAQTGLDNPVRALQAKLAVDAASILNNLKSVSQLGQGEAKAAATPAASTSASSAASGQAAKAEATPATARQALAEVAGQDAGRQASAAALFADAAQLLNNPPEKLPTELRDALSKLLGFRLPADKPVAGEAVRQAFHKSGVLLEARLAAAVRQLADGQAAGQAKGQPKAQAQAQNPLQGQTILPGGDLKSSLLDLQQKLLQFLKGQPQADAQPKQAAQAPARAQNLPPPPMRAGPLQGQPAAEPAVSARMPAQQAAQIVMDEARSALSRLRLLQNASLPSQSDQGMQRTMPRLEWNFEIPLAFGARTDMAQLRIEGESEDETGYSGRVWNVHVALDTEETGVISGAVVLRGQAVSVNLWADREEMAKRFEDDQSELEQVLKESGLEVERLRIRQGVRRDAPALPGRMVDSLR